MKKNELLKLLGEMRYPFYSFIRASGRRSSAGVWNSCYYSLYSSAIFSSDMQSAFLIGVRVLPP